jgi:hypothetical protein
MGRTGFASGNRRVRRLEPLTLESDPTGSVKVVDCLLPPTARCCGIALVIRAMSNADGRIANRRQLFAIDRNAHVAD